MSSREEASRPGQCLILEKDLRELCLLVHIIACSGPDSGANSWCYCGTSETRANTILFRGIFLNSISDKNVSKNRLKMEM